GADLPVFEVRPEPLAEARVLTAEVPRRADAAALAGAAVHEAVEGERPAVAGDQHVDRGVRALAVRERHERVVVDVHLADLRRLNLGAEQRHLIPRTAG